MQMRLHKLLCFVLFIGIVPVWAQKPIKTEYTDFENDTLSLEQVEVRASRGRVKNEITPLNTETLGRQELFRAACCNLGESFTTNPSVDVSYSDAATGARQIKLLGLSGTYVQMMQENIPAFRSAALPFGLGYVPGPWMQSIQVSKGAASVKNGYEGITGQINIEYLKPQGIEAFRANGYYDSNQKIELNLDGEKHLGEHLSTGILIHYEKSSRDHDQNKDGFIDMPKVEQINVMDRWAWVSSKWISQLSIRGLKESRWSGVSNHSHADIDLSHNNHGGPYQIDIDTKRIEGQWKNALIMRTDHNESLALMLKGVYHDADDAFGAGGYSASQKNAYAQLLYESDLLEGHNLSAGLSINHDYLDEYLQRGNAHSEKEPWKGRLIRLAKSKETTLGAYAQYTYTLDETLTAMLGVRYDYSSIYEGFVTPRLHVKYSPTDWFSIRLALGKGYRSPHPIAENVALLSSSRHILVEGDKIDDIHQVKTRYNQWLQETDGSLSKVASNSGYYAPSDDKTLKQEEAWNTGLTFGLKVPIADDVLEINADYYYTNFKQQVIIDRDRFDYVLIYNLPKGGKSYSHVAQIDATYPLFAGFSLTAAYRWQDVRQTEWANKGTSTLTLINPSFIKETELRRVPLTSRYKALATLTYKTPLELWQIDVTYQHNGGGRMPDCKKDAQNATTWNSTYKSFGQLSAQITREFRHFSLYIGGENLTGFKQKNPIIDSTHPFDQNFDASMIWGPTEGAMVYAGFRVNVEKQ